jgi:hypothetical protein
MNRTSIGDPSKVGPSSVTAKPSSSRALTPTLPIPDRVRDDSHAVSGRQSVWQPHGLQWCCEIMAGFPSKYYFDGPALAPDVGHSLALDADAPVLLCDLLLFPSVILP